MKNLPIIGLVAVCGFALSPASAQPCGSPWSQGPIAGPSPRTFATATYDSARGRVVLFGGYNGGTYFGDTWEWAAAGPGGGGAWTLRASTGPTARFFAGLAYDSVRGKTVLFGGQGFSSVSNQTWEWDGTAWTQMFPAVSPPAMPGRLMAYDPSRQRTVLVSGIQSGAGSGVTWEYNGVTWASQPDITPVVSIYSCTLAYDATRSVMVLTGSAFGAGFNGMGVWERKASGWTARPEFSLPPFQPDGVTAFDPVRAQVLYFDASSYSVTTGAWAWNASTPEWQVIASGGPTRADNRTAVYDAAGGQVLLFGGLPSGGAASGETWLFRTDVRGGPTVSALGKREAFASLNSAPISFTAAASGTSPISYRWRLNQVELSDSGPFSGTGTPQLTVNPIDRVYSGFYDAVVTDACGTTIRPATRLRIECYPNCDGSTATPMLTAEDFQCFLNAYASGSEYANCDGSSANPLLTANDFQCFFNKYAAGCQ